MDVFTNSMKLRAGQLDMRTAQPRLGVVSSVRPDIPLAKVVLQPGNLVTGWLPVLTHWIGSGWGVAAPPTPGDQVLVIPQEGYYEHGIIVGYCRSEATRSPQAPVGEYWIVHQSGSSIKLANDGHVHVKGDLRVDGDIYDRYGSLNGLRTKYNLHRHRIFNGSLSDQPSSDT